MPPTADQDPALPRVSVPVGDRSYWLHVQTFGDPSNPAVFVLPGGPGGDFRLLLPLQALSDRHFVVMWDQHGCGLSERASHEEELTFDTFDEELAAVRALYTPAEPVTLIGHSFGGSIATRYAARHPDAVSKLILIEPGPLTQSAREKRKGAGIGGLSTLESILWDNEILSMQDHVQIDYRILAALREATRTYYCDGQPVREYPLWRMSGYTELIVTQHEHGFDYTDGLSAYSGPILVLAGTCGDLSESFQREGNLPGLPSAQNTTIEGAGHISLFLDYVDQTLAVIRTFLGDQ